MTMIEAYHRSPCRIRMAHLGMRENNLEKDHGFMAYRNANPINFRELTGGCFPFDQGSIKALPF